MSLARILVVDDEPALRRTLERSLTHLGFEVVTVAVADEAYRYLAENVVDAVLIDVRMPELRGDALYVAIARRWPGLADRVIMMTGGVWPEDDCPADLAAVPVLQKPFTLEQLRLALAVRLHSAGSDERGAHLRRPG